MGGETLLTTGLYQPLDAAHRFFIEPRVAFSRSLEDVFVDDERVARYEFKDIIGELNFGANVGRYGQARIGYLYDDRKINVDIGSTLMPEGKPVDAGMRVARRARQPRHGIQSDPWSGHGARVPAERQLTGCRSRLGASGDRQSAWRCRFAAT